MEKQKQTRVVPSYFQKEEPKKIAVEEKKFNVKKVEITFDGIKTERVSVL